jgi:ABC-type multidrug transport system ATPase subunit
MITVSGLTKRYGQKAAITDLSFEVGAGTIVALLGPNGAGKTTTVSCLATLERPDAGRAVVAGCDVLADPAGVRARISLTGQFTALDPVLTGRQNLVMFGELLGLRRRQAKARAAEMLTGLDLNDAADRSVKTYSGGMRRRLDLCVSLLVERPVLFLDEPTVGLDPHGRREIWQRVTSMRDQGTTIVLTTQHLEEADSLADDIFVIDGGMVIALGTPADLKRRIAELVCSVRIADDRVRAAAMAALAWAPHVSDADGAVRLQLDDIAGLQRALALLTGFGVTADEIEVRRPSLDEAFFDLTDRDTRTPV